MTKDSLHDFLLKNGFQHRLNTYSYYHPDRPGLRYRVRDLVLRKEKRMSDGGWFRLRSGYISRLEVTPEGKLRGMTT